MGYEISFTSSFLSDLTRMPKHVQKEFQKTALKILRETPDSPGGPIKKLDGLKNFWRYRIREDYRIVYQVKKNKVYPMLFDNRKVVYQRLGYCSEKGTPDDSLIGLVPGIIDPAPTFEEIGRAKIQSTSIAAEKLPEKSLPIQLTKEKLLEWNILERFHDQILGCKTEDDILGLGLPSSFHERLLNMLYPKTIEEIQNEPNYIIHDDKELEEFVSADKSLSSLLLELDSEQNEIVSRFGRKEQSVGPWIVKGGPGSGKSTILLYCILKIAESQQLSLGEKFTPKTRVLFTTYTNSLVAASKQLLKSLMKVATNEVHINTMNKLATNQVQLANRGLEIAEKKVEKEIIDYAIQESKKFEQNYFSLNDDAFVAEEIEWIIIGNGFTVFDMYLEYDRRGRGRPLGKNQRNDLWKIYEIYVNELKKRKLITHDQIVIEATEKYRGSTADIKYDYVFVDEAQDFKPMGLRLCISLCKDPKNIFLTADINQSIYGKGVSWSNVHDVLDFRGRSTILRKNYRSTKEMMSALREISVNIGDQDVETMDAETPYTGNTPTLKFYDNMEGQVKGIAIFIQENLRELRLGLGCSAVLCRTNKEAQDIARSLPIQLRAKYMHKKEIDLEYNGVKVMTIHAAKGLQFPVVVVPGLKQDNFPVSSHGGQDEKEHMDSEAKLFLVACSRAMKRLMVMADRNNPSNFVKFFTNENWDITE